MYGYFSVNSCTNPKYDYIKFMVMNRAYSYLDTNYDLDRIFYDYKNKPSNHGYKCFRDLLLAMVKEDDTIVVLTLFQLGNTIMEIYRTLSVMRAKQVRLIVNKWKVDISITMKKVIESSAKALAAYENEQLLKHNCYDETNLNEYRKYAGYRFRNNCVNYRTYSYSNIIRGGRLSEYY